MAEVSKASKYLAWAKKNPAMVKQMMAAAGVGAPKPDTVTMPSSQVSRKVSGGAIAGGGAVVTGAGLIAVLEFFFPEAASRMTLVQAGIFASVLTWLANSGVSYYRRERRIIVEMLKKDAA